MARSGPSEGRFPFHPLGRRDDATLGNWLRAHHAGFDAVVVPCMPVSKTPPPVHCVLRDTGTPRIGFPHVMQGPWFRRAEPQKQLKK